MKKKIFEYFAHPVFKYKVEDYINQNKILIKYINQIRKMTLKVKKEVTLEDGILHFLI